MKTYFVRFVVLSGFAALTPESHLIAQNSPSVPLNEAEVRQLIVRGEPADHARLSTHFTAMAQQYTTDAKRHESIGQAFSGNTKLAHIAVSQQEHCRQLSSRNLESVATFRELAAHHTKLAAGAVSVPPKASERIESGSGARVPTDAELTRLATTAESAAYASSWRGMTRNPSAPALAANWDRLVRQQRESATEARAAAAMHNQQATTAK